MKLRQYWSRLNARFKTTKQRFTSIYRRGGFGGNGETVSGRGSTLQATAHIRERLPLILRQYNVSTLLDAPCGDFNWMKEIVDKEPMRGVRYIGVDIVAEIVKNNVRLYGTESVRFIEADIVSDPLPAADMVLCRDCFIHLSNSDVVKALKNFHRHGIRYILTNSFRDIATNKNINTGSWRQLNLEVAPFGFPKPIEVIEEKNYGSNGKFLGLWLIADLPL